MRTGQVPWLRQQKERIPLYCSPSSGRWQIPNILPQGNGSQPYIQCTSLQNLSSHCGSMCQATENTKSDHALERNDLLQFIRNHPIGWGNYLSPMGDRELLNLHWNPVSCCKLEQLKCIICGMEHTLMKEGRRWVRILVRYILPSVRLFKPDSKVS